MSPANHKPAANKQLVPNNKISGGKVLSQKVPKGSNRLKIALRNAANAIGNLKDTPLSNFLIVSISGKAECQP